MEKSIRTLMLTIGLIVTIFFVHAVTTTKLAKLDQTPLFTTSDVITIKERERQLDCLARNIYHEAGYEPFEGKVAVAQVTMNRASSERFPNDICKVVYQKNVIMEKVVCQFSWACDTAARTRPINKTAYDESYAVAKKVLLENFRLDVMKDALYYHANYVNPKWPLEKIGSIGNHIFYKGKN